MEGEQGIIHFYFGRMKWKSILSFAYYVFQLLQKLKMINFTSEGQSFYFNTSGNFINGYDLINWVQDSSSGQRKFDVVGNYNLEQGQISLRRPIKWDTPNNSVSII